MSANIDENFDEPYWFSEDPPTWAERNRDYQVAMLRTLLNQAGRGEDAAWCLSTALSMLTSYSRLVNDPALTAIQRDNLLSALAAAYAGADASLPRYCDRRELAGGLAATSQLIGFWASSDARRSAGGEFLQDIIDATRILQNTMHNECLKDQIRYRMANRLQERKLIFAELLDVGSLDLIERSSPKSHQKD